MRPPRPAPGRWSHRYGQAAGPCRLIAALRKGGTIDTEICMFGVLAPDGRLRRAYR